MSKKRWIQEWVEIWRNEFKSINRKEAKKMQKAGTMEKSPKQNLQQKNLTQVLAGGAVYVKVSGNKEVKGNCKLRKKPVDCGDVEMLQDLIPSCVNEALRRKVDSAQAQELGKYNIPGMMARKGRKA